MSGLDPRQPRAIRAPYKRPNAGPHRRFVGTLVPMGRVDPCDDMTQLADTILRRIRRNRHQTVAGSYLLGDPDGNVYVLAEGSGTTEALVAAHESWVVGRYAAGQAVVFPAAVDLVDDLRDHYANLVPAMVYEAIRREEG